MKKIKQTGLLLFSFLGLSQTLTEQLPPPHIQTVILSTDALANNMPIVKKGEVLQLRFDDLYGDETTYYYKIVRAEADWT
ncbi:MAG: type IX secretion system plug protein domain-containing protein, partial [Flavobacteriaceae bacterium]